MIEREREREGRHKWREGKVGWEHLTEERFPGGGEEDEWGRKKAWLFEVGHCWSVH